MNPSKTPRAHSEATSKVLTYDPTCLFWKPFVSEQIFYQNPFLLTEPQVPCPHFILNFKNYIALKNRLEKYIQMPIRLLEW